LDKAVVDLEEAARLDDKNFDIWYHVGLARYLNGHFAKAAEAYERGRAVAASDDSLASISHWLYMSYRRAKKETEAAQVLERITPGLKVEESKAYLSLLLFYKGLKKESDIYSATGMADVDAATIGYGVANWHLYSGNTAKAKEYFQRVTEGKAWAAFGFIGSEVELARMR
jgi:tetratricopeptide (TPR) repeat protein